VCVSVGYWEMQPGAGYISPTLFCGPGPAGAGSVPALCKVPEKDTTGSGPRTPSYDSSGPARSFYPCEKRIILYIYSTTGKVVRPLATPRLHARTRTRTMFPGNSLMSAQHKSTVPIVRVPPGISSELLREMVEMNRHVQFGFRVEDLARPSITTTTASKVVAEPVTRSYKDIVPVDIARDLEISSLNDSLEDINRKLKRIEVCKRHLKVLHEYHDDSANLIDAIYKNDQSKVDPSERINKKLLIGFIVLSYKRKISTVLNYRKSSQALDVEKSILDNTKESIEESLKQLKENTTGNDAEQRQRIFKMYMKRAQQFYEFRSKYISDRNAFIYPTTNSQKNYETLFETARFFSLCLEKFPSFSEPPSIYAKLAKGMIKINSKKVPFDDNIEKYMFISDEYIAEYQFQRQQQILIQLENKKAEERKKREIQFVVGASQDSKRRKVDCAAFYSEHTTDAPPPPVSRNLSRDFSSVILSDMDSQSLNTISMSDVIVGGDNSYNPVPPSVEPVFTLAQPLSDDIASIFHSDTIDSSISYHEAGDFGDSSYLNQFDDDLFSST